METMIIGNRIAVVRVARSRSLVVALALVVGMAGAAAAQEPPVDFAPLQSRTRPGDRLLVTDANGRLSRWTLRDVPVDVLIRGAGLSSANVQEIAVERADSPWNGALIGLAVAGTPWLIVCAANDWCYYNEYGAENLLRSTAIVTAAIGAGIGALVDLSIRQRITIYRAADERSVDIGVSPQFSAAGAAVRVSVGF